jgi:uncharacterized protein
MTDPRLTSIINQRRWRARPERFVLAALAPEERALVLRLLASVVAPFVNLVVEPNVITLVLPQPAWRELSPAFPRARVVAPYRAISFDLDLPGDLVGFLAAATRALADAGVPILAVCGYTKDHLLVREADLGAALAGLAALAEPGAAET